MKTKHDTPKYGLIYHASLIGQTAPKNKGKISRVLAAKTALSVRVDALGDTTGATVAIESRAKVETRMRQLEANGASSSSSGAAGKSSGASAGPSKYNPNNGKALAPNYNPASDIIITEKKDKKRGIEEISSPAPASTAEEEVDESLEKEKKKKKKHKEEVQMEEEEEVVEESSDKKKKKKKDKKE